MAVTFRAVQVRSGRVGHHARLRVSERAETGKKKLEAISLPRTDDGRISAGRSRNRIASTQHATAQSPYPVRQGWCLATNRRRRKAEERTTLACLLASHPSQAQVTPCARACPIAHPATDVPASILLCCLQRSSACAPLLNSCTPS